MQASMFNVRVPLPDRNEVFLMNTFTDAQLLVTTDVADLLERVEVRTSPDAVNPLTDEERATIDQLAEHGFLVADRSQERTALEAFFRNVREDTDQLRITVLTTLQCNFACDYCIQGDHGDYNKNAAKMSTETAGRVAEWAERRLDALRPESFVLTFFGGEPLLNLPVMYYLAERLWASCQARGVRMLINVITNGLLLTPEMVNRLNACGLNGIKITLDGDRDTHNRMRPLRGGQGTFDRIIRNVQEIAHLTRVSIGGNFDMETADSYPALLDFLAAQEFADKLTRVSFKPIIREKQAVPAKGRIPLTAVGAEGKPLNGACMTSAGTGVSRVCDTCDFVDEKMAFLREETKKRGFATVDGVHMGPCEIHSRTRTRSVPTARCSPAPVSPARRCNRSGTSTDGRKGPEATRCASSSGCRRGSSATTAPTSRSAPEGARWRRTTNWGTCTPPTVTSRVSRRVRWPWPRRPCARSPTRNRQEES